MQDKVLSFLYETVPGRCVLKVAASTGVSRIAGHVLESKPSRIMVKPFIRHKCIDMNDYIERKFRSYNDFFTRVVKDDARVFDMEPEHVTCPCDSKLTLHKISPYGIFNIKRTYYTVERLLKNSKLAEKYDGGYLAIFRLDVDDYHRYSYIDDGFISKNTRIKGKLHTVQPIANDYMPIYHENTREYSILNSAHFGKVLVMEVGAMLVGKIVNYHQDKDVVRGEEKGRFELGGSTIILMFQKDKVVFDDDIVANSRNGRETTVKMGQKIGNAVSGWRNCIGREIN